MALNSGSTLSELPLTNPQTIVRQVPRLVRLKQLRIDAAMSQIDLAEKAGVARTTIVRLEAGYENVMPSTVRKLARALRVKPTELWKE